MSFVLPYIKNSTPIYMSVEKMANDSNFDRNRVRGCNFGSEGGATSVQRGCIFDVRGVQFDAQHKRAPN